MTHINAFFAEVTEAEEAARVAQARLATAKAALEAKKEEEGYKEPTPAKEVEVAKPAEVTSAPVQSVTNKKK